MKRVVIGLMLLLVGIALHSLLPQVSQVVTTSSTLCEDGSCLSFAAPCEDPDGDDVCDDDCPNTPEGARVNLDGCSHEEFCRVQGCGMHCEEMIWVPIYDPNEFVTQAAPPEFGCTVAIKENEGTLFPVCAPVVFDQCVFSDIEQA